MAKEKFSKSDLSRVAAQVKRTILRRAKKGIYLDQRLTKSKALKQIATSLKTSIRSLQSGERASYINEWYTDILTEIEKVHCEIENPNEIEREQLKKKRIEELLQIIEEEKTLRRAYRNKVQTLLEENERLRSQVLERYDRT
ncbi:hypothetical protein PDJ82_07455 [Bacillus cereus group sp. TH43LC]|uniref:hypothetical protein n=1 Tax=Bacillus cereus group sp. TH43LC TaxID=3018037 RepID=UPI0022E81DE5|nr:hypothetical protein [Bacillus cereus group sp. TH43LC]MDA1501431.1 hypothetical protein [Bacillus cereus group sp. TH43LC]